MSNSNTSLNSFVPLTKIGEGTFSSVYKVRRLSDQCVYALKKIKIACLKQKEKANALNEIRILASLTADYIITYKQAFFDEQLNLLCIVMEWANQGDLLDKITAHRQNRTHFHEQQIWKAAYHILSGLRVLHRHSILHRDLKSANIFICEGRYKLGDLNVSKVNDHEQRLVRTQTGTPFYASPEVWRDEPYGSPSDVWSLGCILYEMCYLRPPFQGKDLNELYKNVQRGEYEPIPKIYSRELEQIIQSCLKQKAKERPTADQLLREGGSVFSRCDYYDIQIDHRQFGMVEPLLSTIKMPSDMKVLNSKLPESKYETEYQNKTAVRKLNSPLGKASGLSKQVRCNQNKERFQPIVTEQQVPSPLPDRIKSQLNLITRLSDEHIYIQKVISKHKAHSGVLEKNNASLKKLQNYVKRKRPISCNYVPDRRVQYLINLNEQNSPMPSSYNSDRRLYSGSKLQRELISDRRIDISGDLREQRSPVQQEKEKNRARSANNRELQESSSLSDLKQRLEARYQQMKRAQLDVVPEKNSAKVRTQLKSEGSAGKIRAVNYPYAVQPSLSSYIYRSPLSSKHVSERSIKPDGNSYLESIQHKILTSAQSRRRTDNPDPPASLIASQPRIRRLVKGQNPFARAKAPY